MSSYAELTLGTLSLASSRNSVDPDLIWLFRETDKTVKQIDHRNPKQLTKYIMEEYLDDYDENNPLVLVEYRCSAAEAKDRLDLKGFTREVAESAFESCLRSEITRTKELQALSFSTRDVLEQKLNVLCNLTIEDWQIGLQQIATNDVVWAGGTDRKERDPQGLLLTYMLNDRNHCFGFPGADYYHFGVFLRLAIESVSPDEQLVYDLSPLVHGGWIQEDEEPVTLAESRMSADLQLAERVIVVTEGDTDREVLERSIRLLYPHLADYFHFFDFSVRKLGGGAGELVNLVRAFAAAGVQHRVLALFDNDTAAQDALSNLDVLGLPENIAVRHYPDIALARDYQTFGPSGNARMDVNGSAGSLELYLGRDVLADSTGELSPVLWTSYQRKLRGYQGELRDKQRILEDFRKKLARCESNPKLINSYDWVGVRAIIETMRTAFHKADRQAIMDNFINA